MARNGANCKFVDESSCRALLDELEKQVLLYHEMDDLSARQADALRSDQLPAFAEMARLKYDLVAEIQRLHQDVLARFENWRKAGLSLAPDVLEKAKGLVSRASEKIAQLARQEAALFKEAGARQQMIQEEIRKISNGRKIADTYGKTSPLKSPRFVDKKR
jgi:hypothetical protein